MYKRIPHQKYLDRLYWIYFKKKFAIPKAIQYDAKQKYSAFLKDSSYLLSDYVVEKCK